MAYRKPYSKPAAKSARFRIERTLDDKRFLVLDGLAGTYAECATRQEAETECEKLKDALRPKTSELRELPAIREKLRRGVPVSQEEYAALDRPRERDLKPTRPRRDPKPLVAQIRKDLPALCRAWAGKLGRQSGIDDAGRRAMTTEEVIAAVGLANVELIAPHRERRRVETPVSAKPRWRPGPVLELMPLTGLGRAISALDHALRPLQWSLLEAEGYRGALAVHYLSSEPARMKAAYLGLSRSDYFRQLDVGHHYLLGCFAAEYGADTRDLDVGSQDYLERYEADPEYGAHEDDDGPFYGVARKPSDGFWWATDLNDYDSGRFDD